MTRELRTLRGRLLLVALVCVVGTLAVAGASLTVVFEKHVLELIGRDLDFRIADLSRDVEVDEDGRAALVERSRDSRYLTPNSGAYWELTENGKQVAGSKSLGGKSLSLDPAESHHDDGKWFEVEGPDGQELYVVERTIAAGPPGERRTFRLAVALDHETVADARSAFGWDAAFVLGLISLVLVAAAAMQSHVILQPLKAIGRDLVAVREGRKDRIGAAPAEIAPLTQELNRLLDAQELLVKKARERAGSLAHGLKTPLAILSAEQNRLEAEGHADQARRFREQLTAIQTHVERELARARTHGAPAALGAYVDAAKSATRLVRVMSRLPRGETLDWRCETPDELKLRMDPDDFGEILGNLLDNARKWASASVTLRCAVTDRSARIVIEDDGPGFGSNAAAPPSLTAGDRESSAGLGLVIVQDILAAYGSALWIDRAAPNGVVSFVLPGALLHSATQGAQSKSAAPADDWRGVPELRRTSDA